MPSLISTLFIVQTNIIRYFGGILLLCGIFGTIWNLILFSRKKFRLNSCCIYFSYSSIFALMFLSTGLIPLYYSHIRSPDPIFNGTFCKCRAYLTQMTMMLCRWFLTMACVDRSLITSMNPRLRHISDVRIAKKIIWILIFIWIFFPLHTLIYVDVKIFGFISCQLTNIPITFYHWIYTIIFGGILPPLLMLISSKSLWKNLQMKREKRERLNGNNRKKDLRDIQILVMLFIQILVFLLTNLPWMIMNLYLAITASISNKSAERLAIENFLQFLCEMIIYLYPSSTFYTNTLFSKSFRTEFLSSICFYKNSRRISPISLTHVSVRPQRFTLPTLQI